MKKIFFTLLLSFLFFSTNAQEYPQLVSKANEMYGAKDYQKSVALYAQAFKIKKKNSLDLYNGACSAALANNKTVALEWLNVSIDNGWTNISHLKSDADLESLHADKNWEKLIVKLEEKIALIESQYDKPLEKELLEIQENDQEIRKLYVESQKKHNYQPNKVTDSLGVIVTEKDKENVSKVTKILDEQGWVGKDKVGARANMTLFLVIQHADLETQKKYLPMMKEAVANGNANASSLALLVDRIEIREGRKQIYGSQIGTNPTTKGQYVLPLIDPDNVDKRRAEVGLGSIADYIANWNLTWDVEKYKSELPELEKLNK